MSGEELCKQPESDGRPHCDPIQHDSGWNYKGDLIWYKDGTNTFEPYPDDDPRQPWNFVLPDLPPLTIDFTNIKCVYRGEPGCACGCLGDYYYPEWHRDDWKKLRGWGPFKDEEVSDTQIIRVSLIVENIWNKKVPGKIDMCTSGFISAQNPTGTKVWVVHLENRIQGLPDFNLYTPSYISGAAFDEWEERYAKATANARAKAKTIGEKGNASK